MQKISCPNCGHHIANIDTDPSERPRVASKAHDVRFDEWLSGITPGAYRGSDLRKSYSAFRGVEVGSKGFGLALASAGALPSRGTNGTRMWTILPA